jgi:hypothetical protein
VLTPAWVRAKLAVLMRTGPFHAQGCECRNGQQEYPRVDARCTKLRRRVYGIADEIVEQAQELARDH